MSSRSAAFTLSPLGMFDDLLSELVWSPSRPRWRVTGTGASVFAADDHARVVLAAPGVPADAFEVAVVDGALEIDAPAGPAMSAGDGERELARQPGPVHSHPHHVRIVGPQAFDADSVSAQASDGVLSVTVALREPEAPQRAKVAINTAKAIEA